jgi:toxin CcdB
MAQFDVHRNIGPSRAAIPYVVIVQSRRHDSYRRRVVIPLLLRSELPAIAEPALTPVFDIEGRIVILNPLEIASVATDRLGEMVTTLAPDSDRIVRAIDELISRAWG